MAVNIWRHQHRYREIAGTLSRHGLGWLVTGFGLDQTPVLGRFGFRRGTDNGRSRPRHLRLALEELGTTFIKLGQILSTRDDLLPPEYIAELSLLREHVAPEPADAILAVVEDELGAPVSELYASFDTTPLAVASIGQVHAATLADGTAVVVKVRKPRIEEVIEEDLAILAQLAGFAQRHAPFAQGYDVPELVDEFAWTLRNELDYLREGRNADLFRANFAGNGDVVIPRVYWDLTTTRVLTLERRDGLRIDDLPALDAAGIDRPALARRAARVILDEVFLHGFFHADPHPGNFAVLPDGTIVAYDFGMVGRLNERTTRALLSLLYAVLHDDPDRAIDAAIDLDIVRGRVDRPALARDIERMIDRYATSRVEEFDFEAIARDITGLIRGHQLRLPSDLALLLKTLAMHQSVACRIDPGFAPIEVAEPYARELARRRYHPSAWGGRLAASADDAFELLLTGPQRIDRLLALLERGNVEVTMHVAEWQRMQRELEAVANRLVVAWLTGASIIALAVLLAIYRPGWVQDWFGPLFWLGGAVTVVAAGLLVLVALRRRE